MKGGVIGGVWEVGGEWVGMCTSVHMLDVIKRTVVPARP